MEIQDILSLVQAVSDHGLTEFQLDDGKVKLSFKKEESAGMPVGSVVMPGNAGCYVAGAQNQAPLMPGMTAGSQNAENGTATTTQIGGNLVISPLVGTFYSAPSPEAESYVKVGDTVKKGQILGIVEAMKLMNEIESDFDGVVEEILVSNEAVVEYGQPLFRIR